MKRSSLLALALAVVALAAFGAVTYADCGQLHSRAGAATHEGMVNPHSDMTSPQTELYPSLQDGLMRSQVPGEDSYGDFVVGFKAPNRCEVQEISAFGPSEALTYARQYCPDCAVTDLTGLHGRGEAPWEINQRIADFCG